MVLWRISNFADLKGIGGLRAPGRWHFAGQPVVYLAEHPAGALLETLVHQEIGGTADLPDTYQLLKVEVDDGITIAEMNHLLVSDRYNYDVLRKAIATEALPEDWRQYFLKRLDRPAVTT